MRNVTPEVLVRFRIFFILRWLIPITLLDGRLNAIALLHGDRLAALSPRSRRLLTRLRYKPAHFFSRTTAWGRR